MIPKDRSDNMHIEEAARQEPPQGDIEVAKEKINSVYEVWMMIILLCSNANFNFVQENAVGYKEYREGLHMEITAKEVSEHPFPIYSSSNTLTDLELQNQVEDRPGCSPNLPHHAGVAIHG